MRNYASIQPTFWTRGSGKRLRDKPLARLLALYLMTSPASNMLGLYYVSRRTLIDDTGIPESELDSALAAVAEAEIAFYDPKDELVYVPNAARYQIGPYLKPQDNRRKQLTKQLTLYEGHEFLLRWIARYYDVYDLGAVGLSRPVQPPSEGGTRPPSEGGTEAPSDPLPKGILEGGLGPPWSVMVWSDQGRGGAGGDGGESPLVADLLTRAQLWVQDPTRASVSYPQPHRWPEMTELNDLVGQVFGVEPETLRTEQHRGVRNVLARWAEGVPQAAMRQAIRGAQHAEIISKHPENQTLATIFTDASSPDKYARLAKSKDPPGRRDNVVTLTDEAARKKQSFFNRGDK